MNYLMLLVSAQLAIANLSSINNIKPLNETEWSLHKIKYGKSYEPSEDSLRRIIFASNKHQIEEFNAKHAEDAGFRLGLNHLADATDFEIKKMNGFKLPANYKQENSVEGEKFLNDILSDESIEVPDEIDWRKTPGRVSEVKNQAMCGSCWAFATTGVLEGQQAVRQKRQNGSDFKIIELSEQNLVDCVAKDDGCNGGFPEDALTYAKSGIDDETSYPYRGRTGKCRFSKANSVMTDAGYVDLPSGDEEKLKQVVAKFGPVAVAIDASGRWFQYYHSGVYYDQSCKSDNASLDHSVLVVGYGTEKDSGDYWIVKNSWGTYFGESGYIRMARNRGNNCGIATVATIPTF